MKSAQYGILIVDTDTGYITDVNPFLGDLNVGRMANRTVAGKGDSMQGNVESKTIGQLMAEADELIRQINVEALEDVEEGHRRRFEKHIQALEKIKSEGANKMPPKGLSPKSGLAEGMHAAILDIVKAMREFKSNLTSRNEV